MKKEISAKTQVRSLPCLISLSLMLLRLDWCDPGVWRCWVHVTSPCQRWIEFCSLRNCYMYFSPFAKQNLAWVWARCWIIELYCWSCQSCCIDFSKFLHLFFWIVEHGFVKTVTLISLSCHMDLSNFYMYSSKLPHGFAKVVKVDLLKLLYVFIVLCQTKPSWSLIKISKLVEASALS